MDIIWLFLGTGELTALRYDHWTLIFLEQNEYNTLRACIAPWTPLCVPLITNLRRDPNERAHVTSNIYYDWMIDRIFFLVPAHQYVANFWRGSRRFRLGKNRQLQYRSGDGNDEIVRRIEIVSLFADQSGGG